MGGCRFLDVGYEGWTHSDSRLTVSIVPLVTITCLALVAVSRLPFLSLLPELCYIS